MGAEPSIEVKHRHFRRVAKELIAEYGTPFPERYIIEQHKDCSTPLLCDEYLVYMEGVYNRETLAWIDAVHEAEVYDDLVY